ncbi:MAG: 1-acyl-sn-glycerol-3-phosphate acyltransferase [Leptospirales bacterium]|nr:1-acyl-sn-glycerol-3-phosphate acyltransferase [Leptospirales bacterium]
MENATPGAVALEEEKDAFQSIKNLVKPILDFMVDIQPEGLEHIPLQGPAVLVGNHRSDMDPFIVASVVPRYISWVAAEYTERIPIMKNLVRDTGVIPMQIDGAVAVSSIKRIMASLKNGELLGIFPEGHDYMVRNDFTAPMAPFHDGFGIFALRGKAPIVPFVLTPLDESLETIPLPARLRSMLGLPEEVARIPHRIQYRSVRVSFLAPLDIVEYSGRPDAESVPAISAEIRRRMHQKQKETGMVST